MGPAARNERPKNKRPDRLECAGPLVLSDRIVRPRPAGRGQPHLATAAAGFASRNTAALTAVPVAVVLVATALAAGRLADRLADRGAHRGARRLAAVLVAEQLAVVLVAPGLAARGSSTARRSGGAAGGGSTGRLSRSASRGRGGTRGLGGGARSFASRGGTAVTAAVVTEAGFSVRGHGRESASHQQSGQQVTEFHGRLLDVKKGRCKSSGVRRRFATVFGVWLGAVTRLADRCRRCSAGDRRPLASVVLRVAPRAS